MFEDACFSLEEYRRWGYLGREILVNKQSIRVSGLKDGFHAAYASDVRRRILDELVRKNERITVEMYWDAVGRSISRRQAERDLARSSLLRTMGRTKGLYYLRR